MNAKMYVTSVEKVAKKTGGKTETQDRASHSRTEPAGKTEPNPEPEYDHVTLSALPSGVRDGSVIEAHPPAAETPPGQRPPVQGGGTGTMPSPDSGLEFEGELSFKAPTGTVKVDQIYYVDLTPTGEMVPRPQGEGSKRPEGDKRR
jgi:hypothetical protein